MEDENTLQTPISKKAIDVGGTIFGVIFFRIILVFFQGSKAGRNLGILPFYCIHHLGPLLILSPFEKTLKKYLVTKVVYYALQILFAIIYLLGSVFAMMISVFTISTFLLFKTLQYLNLPNFDEITLFLSITLIAITFSFKGNSIVNWLARKMETIDDERLEKELKIINKFFGQAQIRFFIYCLYFFLILVSMGRFLHACLSGRHARFHVFIS